MPIRRLSPALIAVALVSVAGGAFAQDSYPFIGRWGGGPTDCTAPFVFTRDGYGSPGEQPIRWRSIRREGRAYVMTFPDGYQVTVMPLRNGNLSWLSGASGDAFELRRCR